MCCPPASTSGGSRLHGREPQPGLTALIHANIPNLAPVQLAAPRVAWHSHARINAMSPAMPRIWPGSSMVKEPSPSRELIVVKIGALYSASAARNAHSCAMCKPPSARAASRQDAHAASPQPEFCVCDYRRQALAVLSQVTPYLRTYKLERARLLLEEYIALTPRNGRYTADQRARRAQFETRFFSISMRAAHPKTGTIGVACH